MANACDAASACDQVRSSLSNDIDELGLSTRA
jgi:hypothetical protein